MKYIFIILFFLYSFADCQAELIWKQTFKADSLESVYAIESIDSLNTIMLTNDAGEIFRYDARLWESTDGGFSWTMVFSNAEVPSKEKRHALNISWPSENHLYMTFKGSKIIKSTDRGRTFTDTTFLPNPQNENYTDHITNIYMLDSVNGIASSRYYNLFTTTDGWKTYKHHTNVMDFVGDFADVWMFSPDEFICLAGGPWLSFSMKTTDAGETWHKFNFDFFCHGLKFDFVNKNLGYAVGFDDYSDTCQSRYDVIHKTTDGGFTWEMIYKEYNIPPWGLGTFHQYKSVSFYDSLNGIATGSAAKILRTTDGGNTWFQEYLEGHKEDPSLMGRHEIFSNAYIGSSPVVGSWCQREGLWRLTDKSLLTKEDFAEDEMLVYPNPFRDVVNFSFSPAVSGERVSISIYDITGRELESSIGYYSPEMGILQYRPESVSVGPSVYFYKIEIGDRIYRGSLVKE